MERANALGVSVPKLVVRGAIADRYLFRYLVMEYIQGETLGDRRASLSSGEKREIGRQLRRIVDGWATPCGDFNGIDVIARSLRSPRWRAAPERFRAEWEQFLRGYRGGDNVYVHGDLTAENLLVCPNGKLTVIDFADSVRAPEIYETMPIVCDAFCFDRDFLEGYFGHYDPATLAKRCLEGILIHEYGWQTAKGLFGDFESIRELFDKVYRRLLSAASYPIKNE